MNNEIIEQYAKKVGELSVLADKIINNEWSTTEERYGWPKQYAALRKEVEEDSIYVLHHAETGSEAWNLAEAVLEEKEVA